MGRVHRLAATGRVFIGRRFLPWEAGHGPFIRSCCGFGTHPRRPPDTLALHHSRQFDVDMIAPPWGLFRPPRIKVSDTTAMRTSGAAIQSGGTTVRAISQIFGQCSYESTFAGLPFPILVPAGGTYRRKYIGRAPAIWA